MLEARLIPGLTIALEWAHKITHCDTHTHTHTHAQAHTTHTRAQVGSVPYQYTLTAQEASVYYTKSAWSPGGACLQGENKS